MKIKKRKAKKWRSKPKATTYVILYYVSFPTMHVKNSILKFAYLLTFTIVTGRCKQHTRLECFLYLFIFVSSSHVHIIHILFCTIFAMHNLRFTSWQSHHHNCGRIHISKTR
jgi:hypothetical protein